MSKFILTGFADEIDTDFNTQLRGLQSLGIQHIEIRGVNGTNISQLTKEEVRDVQKQLNSYGITASSIGSPIGKIGIGDDFAPHLEMTKRIVETAHTLNSPFIRIFSFYTPEGNDPLLYRDDVLDRMGRILDTAKGSGITMLHENEKGIYGDTAERCLDLMEAFKGRDFAAAFDPANFVQSDEEVYPKAFQLLKPYIKYMHIKDSLPDHTVVPAGMGVGHVREVLSTLKADGYEGFLSLEPHLGSFVGLAALENTALAESLEKGGLSTFKLAHDSLMDILSQI
ncbi:sugar phosphate isomerase/epimerase family protein [Gorillibacterium massiliense]|uniref:sugar phosphate isomerase/epimerase family protein n=1 Tax=Gorillibacterium massiliense TaxID=1280390 RepID=UPI0004B110B5|nr:sugar phosphate isomerase/epimerase family protein [Gorillibacterium massiliense]